MRKSIKMSLGSLLVITLLLTAIVIPNIHSSNSINDNDIHSSWYSSLQQYAEEHGMTVEQLTANWTADDWIRWYKYEGNPSWGSTNITDQFLATDWVKLPNSGNLTWGADYDYEYKYNATSDQFEMWHNGTLVSYLGSDDLWHYASDRLNLTDLHHIVDREYVDHAVTSLGARYYMVNTSSGISDYKLTQLSPPSGSEQSVIKTGLTDDDYIAGWISPDTSMSKLIKGVYNWHIYAEKTGGTQTLRLYWQLVERKSDTTETVIATSAVSNEIMTSKESYIIPLTLSEDYTLADGSYVVGKLYADVSGGGSAPNVAVYYDGDSKSHWEIPINLEIFSDQFLKLDGSNANSDIDISPYDLTVGNISAFNLKLPVSYIIWTDGTTVYALNGTSGLIDYSGTDATTVIQNAIDAITDGTIFIKSGTYLINQSIHLKSDINIIGENPATTILQTNSDISILNTIAGNGDHTGRYFNIQISRITVYKNVTGTDTNYSIDLEDCCYTIIDNVIIDGDNTAVTSKSGIKFGKTVSDVWLNKILNSEFHASRIRVDTTDTWIINNYLNCNSIDEAIVVKASSIKIMDNHIIGGTDSGIYLDTVSHVDILGNFFDMCRKYAISSINTVNDIAIVGNSFYKTYKTGIMIRDGSTLFTICGNTFYYSSYDTAGYSDIINYGKQCTISNNVFSTEGNTRSAIREVSPADYNIYAENIIDTANYVTAIIEKIGTNTKIKGNIGYTTENSSTYEITGDGSTKTFTISHGLATTPTWVDITPTNESMASAMANGWFWNESATTSSVFAITFITAPSNGDKLSFTWYAEV